MRGGKGMLWLLLLVLFAYGCYALVLFFSQRSIIYPGRSISAPSHGALPADATQLWLHKNTEAWFLPPLAGTGPRPALMFFHGNGEIIDFLPGQVEQFRRWGCGVMLVEYPGYGRSVGNPGEGPIMAAAVAAYDALLQRRDVDPRRVTAFGRSLGCGVACGLSLQRPLAGLILQAPFTSLRDFAPQFLVPRFLIRDRFDNRQALRVYKGPVLILHGIRDDIIPIAHGRELARTAPAAELVEMNCAHNDCPPDDHQFYGITRRFMASHKLGD